MTLYIGIDIGGTKIAGGLFTSAGELLSDIIIPTCHEYSSFLDSCCQIISNLKQRGGEDCTVGIGAAGRVDNILGGLGASANMPFLEGKPLCQDLGYRLNTEVRLENDANCMALAEAVDGAGKGYASVFGLIIGTGVGGGFVLNGRIVEGTNGMTGEIGHLPLPYREEADGPPVKCGCGQTGCIDQTVSGGGLSRLHEFMTGRRDDAKNIAENAKSGDDTALQVLDRYFEMLAKAMISILHSFDPEIIVVSGGLNSLPGLYDEVPKRWGKYAYISNPKTKFVPAVHGPMSGMRGAAWLWK